MACVCAHGFGEGFDGMGGGACGVRTGVEVLELVGWMYVYV